MKKSKLIIALIIFILCFISFISCNKDKEGKELITVNGKAAISLTMDAMGGSEIIIVRGTKAWTAESTSWITVKPTSGPANTDVTVTISVGVNEDEERMGSALFTLPTEEFVDAVVVQKGAISN